MRTFSRIRILNLLLITIMLSQLAFSHSIAQDIVICYGNDGHIQLENINDSLSCEKRLISETETILPYFIKVDCQDKSLNGGCLENEPFISNNKTVINLGILKNNIFVFRLVNNRNTFTKIDKNAFGNHVLESYNTVSLII
ncbi:MAG: hypothetical protein GWP19_14855 [Planctomycetia bacterium]|nr:hypothetical protein [Planctomycetia bacterium]